MGRRKFIKQVGAATIAGSLPFSTINFIFGKEISESYDLVAVKGGEPDQMFDRAIKSLGGIGKFVQRGQNVVIKPNIGWDAPPERASNTNPVLVKRVVEHCINAGAKNVYVFDHTCDNWSRCYANSGIEKFVREAGGKMVAGNDKDYYQEVSNSKTSRLKKVQVHELILESEVFINIPVLKNHSSTRLTIAMKNLMGAVWDRWFWHRNDLHQCIAEFPMYRKPDLNIVDAYGIMMRNGPRGVSKEDILLSKSLLISSDIVAADTAAAKIFGLEPSKVSYIQKAHDLGIGTMELSSLNIDRIRL